MSIALILSLVLLVVVGAAAAILIIIVRRMRLAAFDAGYPGLHAYLRAAPRNDEEKRHAVDLALKGVVLCVMAFFFPPLILVGVVPLYYGSRKLCLAWLGLDILDVGDHRSA